MTVKDEIPDLPPVNVLWFGEVKDPRLGTVPAKVLRCDGSIGFILLPPGGRIIGMNREPIPLKSMKPRPDDLVEKRLFRQGLISR